MNVYVYESRREADNLDPISLSRPAFDLRCGAFTFFERIQRLLPDSSIAVFVRDNLAELTQEKFPGIEINPDSVTEGLWLNGTVLWNQDIIKKIRSSKNSLFYKGDRLMGAYLDAQNGEKWLKAGCPVESTPNWPLPIKETSVEDGAFLWDLVNLNTEAIELDFQFFKVGISKGTVDDGVFLLNSSSMTIGEGSRIKAGAVLDGEEGSIIVGENVTVLPGAYLQGPLFVGDNCLIKAGAKIYGGTSIGQGCRVGGEVTKSIFQSWSNKQHGGFIGNAYVGEWVNLGAGANNSNMKNNYSSVRVTVHGKVINTGSLFIGLFVGDHAKTGINTLFNTGTMVGPASNIVWLGFPPKTIPPFSWIADGKESTHLFEKFVEAAHRVKQRRGFSFSQKEEQLFRRLFHDRSDRTSF